MVIQDSITLTDFKTETSIYSVGLDFDFLGEASDFQPFLFIGGGYLVTSRSFYYQPNSTTDAVLLHDDDQKKVAGNVGLGFRFRVARSVAFEIEAYSYITDIDKPEDRLIDYVGTVGIRIFM
jgi:opacity protein-like surface antigen